MNNIAVNSNGSSRVTRGIGAGAWGLAIVSWQAAIWLAWLVISLSCARRIYVILQTHGFELPVVSNQFLAIASPLLSYWYLLILIALPLAALEIGLVVGHVAIPSRKIALARNATVALLTAIPLALLLYALVMLSLASNLLVKHHEELLATTLPTRHLRCLSRHDRRATRLN